MSTAELKSSLHSLIDQVSDKAMLEAIYELLSAAESKEDWSDNISEEARRAIERGLEDVENGRVIPHETVMKNARERLQIH